MNKLTLIIAVLVVVSCKYNDESRKPIKQITVEQNTSNMQRNLNKYVSVKLTSDLSVLTENERKMLPILIAAADKMNDLFWVESHGDKEALLSSLKDEDTREFAIINYGPWDRLNGNKSFVEGITDKPLGANYYPKDMTKEEFEKAEFENKGSIYTFVRRDKSGNLYSIPYYKYFKKEVKEVSDLLIKASKLADNAGLKKY